MDLYYMSSSNVVFVCDAGRMFHTQNKLLVPEWPCIIEVSYIYSSYTGIFLDKNTSTLLECGVWNYS